MKLLRDLRRLRCVITGHDYTFAEEQGIGPTKKQLESGVEGYLDYAKLLCKNCDYEYKGPNER